MRIRTGMRRTTAQMVGTGKKRAGMTSRRGLLHSSVKGKRSGAVSRLSTMDANSIRNAGLTRGSYEKLQKASTSLAEQMELLAEKAGTGGKDIAGTAEKVAEHFNDTMKQLRKASGVLNQYYCQSLKEISTGCRKELEEIGITVASDGSLTVNTTKLEEADAEKVREVLGESGNFAKRIAAVAGRVADNARINAENSYSHYNAAGSIANAYQSRYNFRG